MINKNYIPDDNDENIPDIKKNEISNKAAIGIAIGVFIWIAIFMLLNIFGVIPAFLMRIFVYPVILIVIGGYIFIKYKNNPLK